jgi:hypothetical protein
MLKMKSLNSNNLTQKAIELTRKVNQIQQDNERRNDETLSNDIINIEIGNYDNHQARSP